MKHNNVIPNGHFHKQWQRRVMTWFDQAGQKKSRRVARAKKALAVAPRPVDSLRPAVRCQTLKYNTKLRTGRGFTLAELKTAGLTAKVAKTIGIAVDARRRNRSAESLELNKARLAAYKARLVVMPSKKAIKSGKAAKTQLPTGEAATASLAAAFPVISSTTLEAPRAITAAESEFKAYKTLRNAFSTARLAGIRAKTAAARAEELAAKAK
jgi:large subunit ribosomal protein L13e